MKLWFRLTIVCGALLGLLLGLTPPADWIISRMPSARDHASIKVNKPHPTRPRHRLSKAWNAIRLALHLSNLLSSTVR